MIATCQTLDLACRIGRALVIQTTGEAGDEARALLAEYATPLAICTDDAPSAGNRAWRELLGAASPERALLDTARGANTVVQVDRLAFEVEAGRQVYCRAALVAVRERVIVACADVTDEVVAARLGFGEHVMVWGGPSHRDADYYNGAWHAYIGPSGPRTWQQLVHPDDLPRCVHAFGEAARRRVSTDIEARLRAANGDDCWHRVRFTIVEPVRRWFGSAENIHHSRTAQAERNELVGRERAARADAEQASWLKDQFLAAVSHELRAPLTTMLLWEKVLHDERGDTALHAKALEAIHQSAVAQSRLVADLLDVSRGISGKLFVDLRPLALETVVHGAIAAASAAAQAKRIALTEDSGAHLGKISGDAHRLRQVLDNLLANAIKFTEPGGRIDVSTHRVGDAIAVAVTDSGRGIAAEFLSRMFEPFSQTDDALTRAQGGLGLGLSIAHQLVVLHGGTLVATSAGAGLGATLTITLPAVLASSTRAPEHERTPSASVLDRLRVLIVDDDRRVREALAILLARAGAIVDTADSADAARVRVIEVPPDALVCDVAMPDEDGHSFVRSLRNAVGAVRTLPVIAMTAHATAADAEAAHASGFDLHLAKPIDLERLVASIRELVDARRDAAAS